MADIAVEAFTIRRTTIKTTDTEYANARLAEELNAAYDYALSDMDGETLIIDPEFGPINPYGGTEDLMALLTPILKHVPAMTLLAYAQGRAARMDGGES